MAIDGTLTHPKNLHLAQLLAKDPCETLGILEAMWAFTRKLAPDGAIGKWSNQIIAAGIFSTVPADQLMDALVEAGWLEESSEHRLVVHDWEDWATESLKRNLRSRGRPFAKGDDSRRNVEGGPKPITKTPEKAAKAAKKAANAKGDLQTQKQLAATEAANGEQFSSSPCLQTASPRAVPSPSPIPSPIPSPSNKNEVGSDYNTGESHPPAAAIPKRQENSFSFTEQGTTRRQGLARIGNLIRPPVPKPSTKASPETNNPPAMAESADDRRLREIHEQNLRRASGGQA